MLVVFSDVSSNSNATGSHKAQVFPKQGGQLSPTHSIFCNENLTGLGSDHHQVTPPLHINIRGQVIINFKQVYSLIQVIFIKICFLSKTKMKKSIYIKATK